MIAAYKHFIKKNSSLRKRAEQVYMWPNDRPNWEFRYLSFSIISEIWQNWGSFCRSTILVSCNGTRTRTGTLIPKRPGMNSWQRIAYEALQAARHRPVNPGRIISFRRHEPTWGDQNVLVRAIPVLSPANSADLLAAFGLPFYAPKHLQTVRNACAHMDAETMSEVRRLALYYSGHSLSHPTDILWWIEPNSRTDALFVWLDELEIMASSATT